MIVPDFVVQRAGTNNRARHSDLGVKRGTIRRSRLGFNPSLYELGTRNVGSADSFRAIFGSRLKLNAQSDVTFYGKMLETREFLSNRFQLCNRDVYR
jgi:hypothetical protein